MYPAGVPGITARRVALGPDLGVRLLDAGDAWGYPVLLVHGWGGCAYSFAEMIPALAHAGYRVLALELPGHGLSDKPSDARHFTTRALSDVIRTVVAGERIERFAYVGHSMGGLLGLRMCVAGELEGAERLTLISSAGLTRIPVLPPIRALSPRVVNRVVPALLTRGLITGILKAAFGTKERPTQRDIDQYWAQTQWDGYAWACRACLHEVDFSRLSAGELRQLRMPVLVVTGGRDRVVGNPARRAVLIPTARVVHLPEAGHLVMQECASRVNSEILAFLSSGRRE